MYEIESPKNAPILYDICNIGQDLHQLSVRYKDKKRLKKAWGLAYYAAKAWIIVISAMVCLEASLSYFGLFGL